MRQSRMDGSRRSIALGANVLIKAVGLALDDRELAIEEEFKVFKQSAEKEKVEA